MGKLILKNPICCPYCLNFTKEFYSCDCCGFMVCLKSCAIELLDKKGVCSDCANKVTDHSFIEDFAKKHLNNRVIL